VYGEAHRRNKKRIGAINIRKVMGVEDMDKEKKNNPERFEDAVKACRSVHERM
jgi:phosphatidate phosphatase APP1